jgi:hypothetical protein
MGELKMTHHLRWPLLSVILATTFFACGGEEPTGNAPQAGNSPTVTCPEPKLEPLTGEARPALVTGQAWFVTDSSGMPVPCPARMQIWREGADGTWSATTVEDPDSNVFHKIIPLDDGSLVTIGASKAKLKQWRFTDGSWDVEPLWTRSWGGKFDRLRDIEIGDVDHDGKDEWIIATHDAGVIAVYNPDEAKLGSDGIIELDQKADTFVHEIEIGDIDGDGKLEFFATPTDRNRVGVSQKGAIVMYRYNGESYDRTVVEAQEGTHAKEILTVDLDGDGTDELLGVFEAELDAAKNIVTPVQIRQYTLNADGSFKASVLAEIQDEMCRFLVAGDLDGDGQIELVAAAKKSGLWLLEPGDDGKWSSTNIDANSSGFEHVAKVTDLNGDGTPELYVAADDQRSLSRYVFNAETGQFDKTKLADLPEGFTWNMEAGTL